MSHPEHEANPFGTRISADEIVENLSFFDAWDDRYRYIIDLGRELPPLDEALRTEDRLVRGCQSQVWIDVAESDGRLQLAVDSDAFGECFPPRPFPRHTRAHAL